MKIIKIKINKNFFFEFGDSRKVGHVLSHLLKNMTDYKKSLTLNHLLLSGTRTTKKVGQ